MSSSLFFLFLPTLFNFILNQTSPNYRFIIIINGNQYNLTIEDNDVANDFKLLLLNKTEFSLSFMNNHDSSSLIYNHNSSFPLLEHFNKRNTKPTNFEANSLLECNQQLIILLLDSNKNECFLVAHFDQPIYPSANQFSITFKAEKIINQDNEDDNKDDNEHVVTVITITSIVCLIILYYLLLLFND